MLDHMCDQRQQRFHARENDADVTQTDIDGGQDGSRSSIGWNRGNHTTPSSALEVKKFSGEIIQALDQRTSTVPPRPKLKQWTYHPRGLIHSYVPSVVHKQTLSR